MKWVVELCDNVHPMSLCGSAEPQLYYVEAFSVYVTLGRYTLMHFLHG